MARGDNRVRSGFTLVETLMAVVVASLIMAIGVPKFLGMRDGLRLDGAAYQLAGDLAPRPSRGHQAQPDQGG